MLHLSVSAMIKVFALNYYGQRSQISGGTENKRFKKEQMLEALTDIRTWLIVLTVLMSEPATFARDFRV